MLVIYVRGKADGRKKLYSAVKKKGGIVSFEPLGDAELNGWIVRVFQQNGKKCAPDVASLLSFTVGNDTALLRAEIEKLTALAGDRDTSRRMTFTPWRRAPSNARCSRWWTPSSRGSARGR